MMSCLAASPAGVACFVVGARAGKAGAAPAAVGVAAAALISSLCEPFPLLRRHKPAAPRADHRRRSQLVRPRPVPEEKDVADEEAGAEAAPPKYSSSTASAEAGEGSELVLPVLERLRERCLRRPLLLAAAPALLAPPPDALLVMMGGALLAMSGGAGVAGAALS